MHIEYVTITRVISLRRTEQSRYTRKQTVFGFEAGKLKKPYVTVAGWPRIEVGDSLAVALKSAGDWQSVLGWRNLTTGELSCSDPVDRLQGVILSVGMTLYFGYSLVDSDPDYLFWAPFLTLVGIWLSGMSTHGMIRAFKTRAALRALPLPSAADAKPPPNAESEA